MIPANFFFPMSFDGIVSHVSKFGFKIEFALNHFSLLYISHVHFSTHRISKMFSPLCIANFCHYVAIRCHVVTANVC